GALAEDSIRRGVEALSEQDPQKARAVVEQDDRVDEMEAAIEEECVRLLALQQPMAVDLRLLATIMKVVTDLERLGDYAVNIAQTAVAMAQEPLVKPLVDIPRMARLAMGMVRESLEALIA